jgi:hypothetical protein
MLYVIMSFWNYYFCIHILTTLFKALCKILWGDNIREECRVFWRYLKSGTGVTHQHLGGSVQVLHKWKHNWYLLTTNTGIFKLRSFFRHLDQQFSHWSPLKMRFIKTFQGGTCACIVLKKLIFMPSTFLCG